LLWAETTNTAVSQARVTRSSRWRFRRLRTPATHAPSLAGVRSRLQRQREDQVTLAWETAVFVVSAQSKQGLQPLSYYIERVRPRKPRSGQEIVQYFTDLSASGADVTVTTNQAAAKEG